MLKIKVKIVNPHQMKIKIGKNSITEYPLSPNPIYPPVNKQFKATQYVSQK
jgi:hypothetical protein